MVEDVILNKASSIERCIRRIEEEYAGTEQSLIENQTKQDAIVLNLQRACETAIDLAMYVISHRKLGVPQDSRDAFVLLQTAGILPADLANRMQRMVGFRNVAVHEYTRLNLDIVLTIITTLLNDFRIYSATIVKTCA
ncbi:type VII toxin-antitoxin system HepT family RNase toxin [Nitrospira sp. CMX1]